MYFHQSRHCFATLALEKGMPIESVSKILGHTKITTTQIYAKVTTEKLDRDISAFGKEWKAVSKIQVHKLVFILFTISTVCTGFTLNTCAGEKKNRLAGLEAGVVLNKCRSLLGHFFYAPFHSR